MIPKFTLQDPTEIARKFSYPGKMPRHEMSHFGLTLERCQDRDYTVQAIARVVSDNRNAICEFTSLLKEIQDIKHGQENILNDQKNEINVLRFKTFTNSKSIINQNKNLALLESHLIKSEKKYRKGFREIFFKSQAFADSNTDYTARVAMDCEIKFQQHSNTLCQLKKEIDKLSLNTNEKFNEVNTTVFGEFHKKLQDELKILELAQSQKNQSISEEIKKTNTQLEEWKVHQNAINEAVNKKFQEIDQNKNEFKQTQEIHNEQIGDLTEYLERNGYLLKSVHDSIQNNLKKIDQGLEKAIHLQTTFSEDVCKKLETTNHNNDRFKQIQTRHAEEIKAITESLETFSSLSTRLEKIDLKLQRQENIFSKKIALLTNDYSGFIVGLDNFEERIHDFETDLYKSLHTQNAIIVEQDQRIKMLEQTIYSIFKLLVKNHT